MTEYRVALTSPVNYQSMVDNDLHSDHTRGIEWLQQHYPGINFLVDGGRIIIDKGYHLVTVFTFYDSEIATHFKLALQ